MWRALVESPSVWFLCLAYFSNSYGSYFVMTWLPTYLAEQRGFQKESLSFFSGLPLLLSVFGDISGGAVTDFLTRRFGLRLGRSGVAVLGYAVAGAAMFASVVSATPVMAALADRGGRRRLHVYVERQLGNLYRYGRRTHRRPQRGHEHHGTNRIDSQPGRHRLGGRALFQLASAAAHHGRPLRGVGNPMDAGGSEEAFSCFLKSSSHPNL